VPAVRERKCLTSEKKNSINPVESDFCSPRRENANRKTWRIRPDAQAVGPRNKRTGGHTPAGSRPSGVLFYHPPKTVTRLAAF
jgi:hypothetical protein